MCLEEMFSTRIEEGAIFYGETRRREQVYFSSELREEVENMFSEMHEYYKKNYTPKVKKTKACQSCSLKNLCLPKLEKTVSVKKYMRGTGNEKIIKYFICNVRKWIFGIRWRNNCYL